MSDIYRKCPYCGTVNLNEDYCQNCGKLINTQLKRKQEREKKIQTRKAKEKLKKPNKVTLFFDQAREHKNPIIRIFANFFYSIWVVVIAIGSFLAFLFGYIAA